MGKVIGIDLGTTNSVVAVMEGGEPVVIPNSEGGRTTPSVVAFTQGRRAPRWPGRPPASHHEPGEHGVLHQAVHGAQAQTRSRRRRSSSPTTWITIRERDGFTVKIPNADKTFNPPEISAMILQKMRQTAEDYLGTKVSPGRHHGARRTSTMLSARPRRTPARSPASRCSGSSTSRPPRRSRTASTRRPTRRSRSSTSVAVRTTSRSWSSGDGVFEVKSTQW